MKHFTRTESYKAKAVFIEVQVTSVMHVLHHSSQGSDEETTEPGKVQFMKTSTRSAQEKLGYGCWFQSGHTESSL